MPREYPGQGWTRWASGAHLFARSMKPRPNICKCLHSTDNSTADHRNRECQESCSKPDCRQAGKRASQQRWLQKPENRDYFRHEENIDKVRKSHKAHPRYWKRSVKKSAAALKDLRLAKAIVPEVFRVFPFEPPSRDLWFTQHPLVVGLIAQITPSTSMAAKLSWMWPN